MPPNRPRKMGLFLRDEEMGKKDDDLKLPKPTQWNAARVHPRRTLRRLLTVMVLGFCIYVFVANIPTDLGIKDSRRPVYLHDGDEQSSRTPERPATILPQLDTMASERPKAAQAIAPTAPYNGPVKFPALAATLQGASEKIEGYLVNRNVLFAASSLKSAATLLPMACQMGMELRNYVHFALMGSSDITIEELRAINGIDDSCHIIHHDARLDFASSSTENRLGNSVVRALVHISTYLHPQSMFVDAKEENAFFLRAVRREAPKHNMAVIELPGQGTRRLSWMTKLDSAALAAWHKVTVDILVQAAPGSSGSLIRLLKSLAAADFTSCSIPHLTIELPHDIDAATVKYLEKFQWPPSHAYNPTHVRQLSLRHRIPRTRLTEEDGSVRFFESFWPADPKNSHVLVLSPQAELSHGFYHYLKYALLEYTHSNIATERQWESRLMAISLDLPSVHLNASEPFHPPTKNDVIPPTMDDDGPTSFLWQAPNSNAVLFLGEKWVELHNFVSKVVETQHNLHSVPPFLSQKDVSKRYPAWLEYALKLSRARGYLTLYPSRVTASSLVTVHKDLWQPPEEHQSADLAKDATESTEITLATRPDMVDELHNFSEMPLLLWDGTVADLETVDKKAVDYTGLFRLAVGGCEALPSADLVPHATARDLFCQQS